MRIVSLAPDITEYLCRFGLDDEIVGVSRCCDEPPHVRRKPRVGDFISVQLDDVRALRPDIVFLSTNIQRDIARELTAASIPTLVLQPKTFASIYEGVRLLGRVTDRQRQAEAVILDFEIAIERARERALRRRSRPRMYVEEWGSPLIVAIGWIGEMIEIAGGQNVFPEMVRMIDTADRTVSLDELRKRQPEIGLLSWCGLRGKMKLDRVITDRVARDGGDFFRRDVRLIPVDDSLFVRPGPRLVHGLDLLGDVLDAHVARQPLAGLRL